MQNRNDGKPDRCALCGRPAANLRKHHLIPRCRHRNKRDRKAFGHERMKQLRITMTSTRLRSNFQLLLPALLLASLAGATALSKTPKQNRVVPPAAVEDGVAVYFSPEGGAADALIHLINGARDSVRIQAFMFTHKGIRDAVIAAHRRGVAVELIMDDDNSSIPGSARPALRRAGITVYVPPEDLTMHNKVILIDDRILATGSFNFTWSADRKNVENLLILRDKPRLMKAFLTQHETLKRISKKYASQDSHRPSHP